MVKKLYSTSEVARILGISRVAVFKRIRTGALKAQKAGRNFVIDASDLPIEHGGRLTDKRKQVIARAVEKTMAEYGETLRLLGKE